MYELIRRVKLVALFLALAVIALGIGLLIGGILFRSPEVASPPVVEVTDVSRWA